MGAVSVNDMEIIRMKRGIYPILNVCVVVVFVALAGCGNQSSRKEITETRTVANAAAPSAPESKSLGESVSKPAKQDTRAFTWTPPDGWVSAPATSKRLINFKVGPPPEAECYVTVLKGGGGGVVMNVNRWRDQMGQAPISEEAIALLPKITAVGQEAPLVEVSGAFKGMGSDAKEGYMLLGVVCERSGEGVFVKMTGPEETVKAQRDNFIAFCGSLK